MSWKKRRLRPDRPPVVSVRSEHALIAEIPEQGSTTPAWSAATDNTVIADAIVETVRSAAPSHVRAITWTWGHVETADPEPEVEIAFSTVGSDLTHYTVGVLTEPDPNSRAPLWGRNANRIVQEACDVLTADVMDDVHVALDSTRSLDERLRAHERACRVLRVVLLSDRRGEDGCD